MSEAPEFDWKPPPEMAHIFKSLASARRDIGIDGDGMEACIEELLDAVEALAKYVAWKSE